MSFETTTKVDDSQWSIIIDTDSYAGQFERKMGSYITGLDGHFPEFCKDIQKEYGFQPMAHGANWNEFDDNPFALLFVEVPVYDHLNECTDMTLFHIEPTPGWGKMGGEPGRKLDGLSPAMRKKIQWPSYQSVRIFCYEKPSQEQLKIVKTWALKFARKTREETEISKLSAFSRTSPINILGFRLVRGCEAPFVEEIAF